ncbi:MAG: hypothetical protein QM764_06670 [Chitinophagaceae bacterium]
MIKQSILLLLIFSLFASKDGDAQQSFLFLKKNGHKKRTWYEGDVIRLRLVNGDLLEGPIKLLKNDSIYINDLVFRTEDVQQVIIKRRDKKPFPINGVQALYIAGGVGLATVGMKTAGWTPTYGRAFWYSSIIGFGPIMISYIAQHLHFKRTHIDIGGKFRLQVLDFYLPPTPPTPPKSNRAF